MSYQIVYLEIIVGNNVRVLDWDKSVLIEFWMKKKVTIMKITENCVIEPEEVPVTVPDPQER